MASPTPNRYRGPAHLSLWFPVFCLTAPSIFAQSVTPGAATVLVYSATERFRHDSTPTAVGALKSRSTGYNITFEDTEDLTWFREDRLRKYDAIVFLSTTGEGEPSKSRSVLRTAEAEGLCSPRHRRQDCVSELHQQRREFRRNPCSDRLTERHYILWARSR